MIDGEATFAGVGLPRRRAADAGMIGHVSIPIPAVAMSSPCGDSSGPALRPLGRRPNLQFFWSSSHPPQFGDYAGGCFSDRLHAQRYGDSCVRSCENVSANSETNNARRS